MRTHLYVEGRAPSRPILQSARLTSLNENRLVAFGMELVRHLATSYGGTILAAAEYKSVVHIWDLRTLAKLNTFETTLDFGGTRLAISPDGKVIAVGAWARHGIAVYRVRDGVELWRRKDLTNVQYLDFDRKGRRLWCCFHQRPCHHLESATGETVGTFRGTKKLWENPLGFERLQERSQDFILLDEESRIASIPKISFSALGVAFSKSEVCISEVRQPVRVFRLSSAAQLWRHDPPEGVHYLKVAFSAATERFVGVSWAYEKGGARVLSHFDEKGVVHPVCELPDSVFLTAFCMEGTRLVTNEGTILETQSGRIEGQLPF